MSISTRGEAHGRSDDSGSRQSFLRKYWQRLTALAIWVALIGALILYFNHSDVSLAATVLNLIYFMQGSALGPLIFILVYAIRPLTFFSAALLTIAGGFLFGPLWGVVYVVIGSNLSATVAYLVGRYFGQDVLDAEQSEGMMQKYATRMRSNSFETILIMRFVFLPYDLVNYLAGFLDINYRAFILATILGSIPGTITFVLLGASITPAALENLFLTGQVPSPDYRVLLVSAIMFVVSLALSRYFKHRESEQTEAAAY